MISIPRVSAVLFVLLATACGGASDASDPASPDTEDTSEDELNTKARFTHLRSGPHDADLKSLHDSGGKFEYAYRGVYRFNKPGSEATDRDARMKRIKEVMHRYMCSLFDESIDLSRPSGSNAVKNTLDILDFDRNAEGTTDVGRFSGALGDVFKKKDLDVVAGYASGNNTAGEVMGVYDVAHNEILFFGFTNCGSDD